MNKRFSKAYVQKKTDKARRLKAEGRRYIDSRDYRLNIDPKSVQRFQCPRDLHSVKLIEDHSVFIKRVIGKLEIREVEVGLLIKEPLRKKYVSEGVKGIGNLSYEFFANHEKQIVRFFADSDSLVQLDSLVQGYEEYRQTTN